MTSAPAKAPPVPREVPINFKEQLVLETVKSLPFFERLKLLFGFNLKFTAVIYTEHKTGRTTQAVKVELTDKLQDAPPKNRVVVVR